MVYRLEDPEKRFVGTPVVKATQGDGDPHLYILSDDGKGSDAVAGDHVWVSFANLDPDQPVNLELHRDTPDGELVFQKTVTVESDGGPMQAVFRMGGSGVTVDTRPEAVAVGKVPPPSGTEAPIPQDAPVPSTPWVSTETIAAVPWIPIGLGLLSLTMAGVGWMIWRGRLLLVPPPRNVATIFGISLEGPVIWVLPAADIPGVLRTVAEQITVQQPLLSVGGTSLEGIGHLWRLRQPRPSPAQVRRAIRSSGAFPLLEGLDSLEAPLEDEGAAAVLEELLGNYKGPLLVLLRESDPLPKGLRPVRWLREGEDLVGPHRLSLQNGRWTRIS
jgi:hypothetical protein